MKPLVKHIQGLLTLFSFLISLSATGQDEALSLSGALERAMEKNYGILISGADVEIATTNNDWGNAGRYPSIGFDVSDNISYDLDNDSYTNRVSAGVGMNWTLFDGFRVTVTKSRLEELEQLSRGRLGVMIESSIEDVILGYYNVLLQQEQMEVLRTVMELSGDRYQYEMKAKALGGSVTFDVLQAQNVYLSDKASFMNQEVVVRNAVRNLNFLMGEGPEKQWLFQEEFQADTTKYQLSDMLEKMRTGNQNLKNQYTNLLLKEQETSLKKASWYPGISMGAGVDFGQSWTNNPLQPSGNGSFSPYGNLRLSYDIYSGGVRKRAVEVARINEEIARIEIREMEHALTNELFNLFDFYQVRIALLNVANENLEAAELNLSISEDKYRTGVINSFNYRDIQLIYLNAAVRRLQAVYNLISSRTELTRITGGFLNQPETPSEK